MRIFDQQRREGARLCEALGVDPGRVIDIQWHSGMKPGTVELVILDDPVTHLQHVEIHTVPEGWEP